MTIICDVLNERRDALRSAREIEDFFERLIAQCYPTNPEYPNQFNEVWMWMDWPDCDGAQDAGIDAVGKDRCIADVWHDRLSKGIRGKQTCAANAHQTCKSDPIKIDDKILRGEGWLALGSCGKRHGCSSQKAQIFSVGA